MESHEFVTNRGVIPPAIEPFLYDRPKNRGDRPLAGAQRALLSRYHTWQQSQDTSHKSRELRDVEFLTSRLADREMQMGEVVSLSNGTFRVGEVFVEGGAYVSVLHDVNATEPVKIICRGTAMRLLAKQGLRSGLNNLVPEIGARGVQAVWGGLCAYLKNTGTGSVEVMGKSMGGACAQQLSLLLECVANIRVKKLSTCCSVGVGEVTNALFIDKVLRVRTAPFEILVVRNGGDVLGTGADYIPTVGGVHLGFAAPPERCNVEVCYLGSKGAAPTLPQELAGLDLAAAFLQSFSKGHCRQSTLGPFNWLSLTAPVEVDAHLEMGRSMEALRQRVVRMTGWGRRKLPNLDAYIADLLR